MLLRANFMARVAYSALTRQHARSPASWHILGIDPDRAGRLAQYAKREA